jgi:hypothetical protein
MASSLHPANQSIKFVPGLRPSTERLLAAAYLSVEPVENREYVPSGVWATRGLAKIMILGFSQDYAYLAYGLEAFLLREIETPYNKVRSARASNS